MESEAARRMFDHVHREDRGRVFHDGTETQWSKTFTPQTPYRYDDGAHVFASPTDLNLGGDFLSNGEAVDDDGSAP